MSTLQSFRLFPYLPVELRQQIWADSLSASIPQVYRFSFRYPKRGTWKYKTLVADLNVQPGDCYYLQPHCTLGSATVEQCYKRLEALRHGTHVQRKLAMTCVESRAAVLDRFPYRLNFRLIPKQWMEFSDAPDAPKIGTLDPFTGPGWDDGPGSPDVTSYPEHVLRFGAIDIFLFDAFWHVQESILAISWLPGNTSAHDNLSEIRHVGIYDDGLKIRNLGLGIHECASWQLDTPCSCETALCADYCRCDTLPAFLALFPRLEAFYIVPLRTFSYQSFNLPPLEAPPEEPVPSTVICPCVEPLQQKFIAASTDPGAAKREPPTPHWWPTAQPTDFSGTCMIHDERAQPDCPLPRAAPALKGMRNFWKRNFPYYRALEHLKIRLLRTNDILMYVKGSIPGDPRRILSVKGSMWYEGDWRPGNRNGAEGTAG